MRVIQTIDPTEKARRGAMNRSAKFWAVNPRGEYLHMDGKSVTEDRNYRWRGNRRQLELLNRSHGGGFLPVIAESFDKSKIRTIDHGY